MRRIRAALFSRLSRLQRDEAGVTLAELIVTIALMGMLLAMVMTIFITFTRTFAVERSATANTSAATIAMNELTRVIRSGTENPVASVTLNEPVFSVASPENVVLQAYLDTDALDPEPVRVQFQITADRTLVETRWDARALSSGYFSFYSTPASERTVVRQIAAGSTSVFQFYTKENIELTMPASGYLSESDRRLISAVKVTMTVQTDPSGNAKTATLENTVGIPNLGFSRIGIDR
ncbi:type II secretion system protein [Salinibacterium sp. NSLL150]|uniref:pilus assembly FimT family protein n=1 Tax=unclassified Salinibacterium TaxID=2632331 RepID=UPI0018CF1F89|nr:MULTISPECIES: prepilin-type N-terminal cleavage/methylation domain-containing protein [unclassified Salinibacterium]MBH0098210.1 type II secretion system protein [Salinibacterium sp. NSLL35]MBH0100965.1 type II secretion system protein [Salinibacterium sp. NSLL150]MBH0103724.1 type II secretion system protein [Salinibacterium sp. NSLL16]MBH0106485.1 type II secretion system protein [Salinibacterium sp. NSLL17]MBH0109750.1 type II secretion system protein [Salinibacterium sp. NG22]